MIEGMTKSGFAFQLDDDVMDDYEVLELLCDIDSGNVAQMPKVVEKIETFPQKRTRNAEKKWNETVSIRCPFQATEARSLASKRAGEIHPRAE